MRGGFFALSVIEGTLFEITLLCIGEFCRSGADFSAQKILLIGLFLDLTFAVIFEFETYACPTAYG